jgi:hypothetical protein
VAATAPAGTAYAEIAFEVLPPVAGTWYFGGFTATIQPNSLDEVPDGGGRFAAIETGADKTLNHVLTTAAFGPPSSVTGNGTITLFAWDVISNDPSDVFNLSAECSVQFPASDTINLYAYADGTKRFGYGQCTSQNSSYPQNVPFIGSVTGLAAGPHTITLTFETGGIFSATIIENTCYTLLQQISS